LSYYYHNYYSIIVEGTRTGAPVDHITQMGNGGIKMCLCFTSDAPFLLNNSDNNNLRYMRGLTQVLSFVFITTSPHMRT